ncbi:MaoC family dehydratase [Rubrivirga marina]|uniref:Nodulation protein NodN n=1 Tax=Rubrivirga marina TaxID=1196024 RepID=A0A271IV52_9BACT|nr:MaoC family dehydratase [Rubrivirga marina]PAP74997.1 nodulation protein NodN [Rubrivirga marina]
MPSLLDSLQDRAGDELGVSSWVTIDQDRIDAFAACTGDRQWIHVDRERAARESPFGRTIAHGYLTLSLLPMMNEEIGIVPEGVASALNYGSDKVRFLAPVPSGSRVRARTELVAALEKRPGQILLTLRSTVEIEGEETPALVADTLALLLTDA